MTDMIERVARAICENDGGSPDKDTLAGFLEWEIYRQPAIASIKAMREPSDEMERAGADKLAEKGWEIFEPSEFTFAYKAMIDAALGEQK